MRRLWQLAVCLLAFTTLALGQAARTATLVGTVTDSTGALIPGAKITVVNTETAFTSNGVTNAEGAYYIPFLAVGPYELTVESSGFKKFVQKGITLRAAEVPNITVQLEVGAATQSVEVTGAAPLLQTETAQVSQTTDAKELLQIPVHQMKIQRILYYAAGLQMRGANANILGQSSNAIGFTLDGINGKTSITDAIGDTNTSVQPALDALAETKVYTTGAPAEMGHASGGILAMTFKSGTNDLHGALEDRYTNNQMTHLGYLQQGALRDPLKYHQALASFSGPVVLPKIYNGRNKTFFLFAYGRADGRENNLQTGSTPDLEMLAGDFSFPRAVGGGFPIYDPKTIRLVGTTWTADAFPNMRIPTSRFDPVIANFLALKPWKDPNNNSAATFARTGTTNNYLGQTQKRSYRSRFDFKVDQQLNTSNKFFVRNSWNRHREPLSSFPAFLNDLSLSSAPPGRPTPIDQQNWAFADYHTFSPTLMNEVRLGFGRRNATTTPPTAGTAENWAKKLGIPNVGPGNFPSFGIYGVGPGGITRATNEDVTFQNNVTKVTGRHTIKFGYELIRTRQNNVDEVLPSGSYSFSAAGTALPFVNNTGNQFASFLLGSVTSATFTEASWNRLPRWWSHAGYVQTDWKAQRNLTLNLGLRYSLETPFQDKWGHQSQFDPTAIDPKTGLLGAITHPTGSIYKTDTNNLQPRVGLAWNFNQKMVFRGSWGMLTQDLMPSAGFQDYVATAQIQQVAGDPRPAFYLSEGPPNRNFIRNPDGTPQFLGTNYSSRGATMLDKNLRLPYIMNWSGGVQTQLAGSWVTELLYQGSAGVGVNSNGNINQLPQSIYNSTDSTFLTNVVNAVQNYRPYTQFGTIAYTTNAGHNTYHGFTTRVEKRYASDGLTLNAHYTWSKSLTGTQGDGWQYYNWGLTKALANFDTRHRILLQASYDIPVGKGRKLLTNGGWLAQVLGGWNLLVIQSPQSGPPVTFSIAGNTQRYLPGPTRPIQILPNDQIKVDNWTMGPNRFPQSAQNPFYNISGFAYAPSFTNSPLGASTQTGRWVMYNQWSISKSWKALEKYKFTVRLDGNNIPVAFVGTTPNSTVNLTDPSTFGKFGLQTGLSYSTVDQGNGQLVFSGRLEF